MRDDTPFRRLPSIVVALLLLMPVAALADDFEPFDAYGDQEEDLDEQVSSTSPAPAPTPRASAPDRSAARPATRAGSSAPAAAASTDNRPTSPWSVGIGAGWVFAGATNLLQPNTASVRVGLGKRFAIEPSVVLGLNEGKDHSFTDDPRLDAEQEIEQGDKTNALAMGVHGRMVLTSRGNLDLQALAGLTVSRTSAEPFAWDLVEDEDMVGGEFESYSVRTSVSW
ncbi:MAG: hypothetical protein ACOC0J_03180, partial [Myxococcota bacterium]